MIGDPPGCPGEVGSPSQMSGSSRETLPNICKILMDIQEWSVGPPVCLGVVGRLSRCPGVVGRASRMTGSGREALPNNQKWLGGLPDVRDWSGDPPGCPWGWEALQDVQEWSGVSRGCSGVVGRRSRMSGSGWKALLDVRKWWGGPLGCPGGLEDVREWLEGPFGCPGVVG